MARSRVPRMFSFSGFNSLNGGYLRLSQNPSTGNGGTCFGDSGGPVFVNNTNRIVSVVSYGNSKTCHGADYSWRVDTQDSYTFLSRFVTR